MAKRKVSAVFEEVRQIKKLYYKELHAAQARYRYYMKRPENARYSVAFEEAKNTGGQFSFAKAKDVGDIYAEIIRMRQFTALDRNATNLNKVRVEAQARRANQVLSFFEPGLSVEQRLEKGMDPNIAKTVWEIYRRLNEEAPGLINYGGVMSSEQFVSLLYNEISEGMGKEEVQARGHELIESMKHQNPDFIKDIPIDTFMSSKKYASYRNQMSEDELILFQKFKELDPAVLKRLLGGDYGI